MIIINLMGGLGNQMFQYAAARHLAILRQTELRYDATRFDRLTLNKEHTVQLTAFRIAAKQASRDEIERFVKPGNKLVRELRRLIRLSPNAARNPFLYEEPEGSAYKPDVLGLGPDRYLIGYFNSYKYFSPIRKLLIREFTPKEGISPYAQSTLEKIGQANSVGLHIRRGDYVSDPNVRKGIEDILTERYYENAVRVMASRVREAHFFVFSNDMPWVMEHLRIPGAVTFVNHNPPDRGFEDLWLMSRCRHNILAGGSTFSWWAAYLNENPGRIVIRTRQISSQPSQNHPQDYFPADWDIAES